MIIRGYATNSHHKVILENIQNVRAACGDAGIKAENKNSRDSSGKNIIRDSPLSPPHSMDSSSNNASSILKANKRNLINAGQRTLFDVVINVERSQNSKRPEFTGRLCTPTGQVAKLYPDFGSKEKEASSAASVAAKDETLPIKTDGSNLRS
ncbi:protein asunder-like [Glossina fuscipes]|uniref:Protein asunder-like n=1 Tax=Glossina fuscipes TaxID=7396 RepID=A0A9C5ZJL4_9MUSC|nr:protein asunder-like [Glossina fuscipes]